MRKAGVWQLLATARKHSLTSENIYSSFVATSIHLLYLEIVIWERYTPTSNATLSQTPYKASKVNKDVPRRDLISCTHTTVK